MKKMLAVSILINLIGITFFVLFRLGNSIVIKYGPSASFFVYEDSYVEASGMLVSENFKSAYPLQLYLLKCEQVKDSARCQSAIFTLDKGYLLSPEFEEFPVIEWGESKIVGVQDFACRKQYWVFDKPTKSVRIESVYKSLAEQRGDCSSVATDVRRSRLLGWSEALAGL